MRWFIRGLSLRVEPSAWYALFLVTAAVGAELDLSFPAAVVSVITVVLVREIAQAAVLARFRPRMIFSATGGETVALKPVSEARAVTALLAGPAALFYLAAVCHLMEIRGLYWVALGWGGFSLWPLLPLPGGRILALLLSGKWVRWLSVPLAAWLVVHSYPSPAAVLIFSVCGLLNLGRILRRPLSFDRPRDDAAQGADQLRQGRFALAEHTLRDAFDAAPSDHAATQLASALLGQGRLDDATRLLEDPVAGPELFTSLMAALFYAGRHPEAARAGERSWALKPDPLTAFNLACTCCRLEQSDTALAWLSRALDAGWRNLDGLDEDPDLAPLRSRPEWTPLRARLTSLGTRV